MAGAWKILVVSVQVVLILLGDAMPMGQEGDVVNMEVQQQQQQPDGQPVEYQHQQAALDPEQANNAGQQLPQNVQNADLTQDHQQSQQILQEQQQQLQEQQLQQQQLEQQQQQLQQQQLEQHRLEQQRLQQQQLEQQQLEQQRLQQQQLEQQQLQQQQYEQQQLQQQQLIEQHMLEQQRKQQELLQQQQLQQQQQQQQLQQQQQQAEQQHGANNVESRILDDYPALQDPGNTDGQGQGQHILEGEEGQHELRAPIHDTDVGVLNPEEFLHNGDAHAHDHGGAKGGSSGHAQSEESARQAAVEAEAATERAAMAKKAFEAEELRMLEPQIAANPRDPRARAAAEMMKKEQFGPYDVESIVHGGAHVHGDSGKVNEKAGSGDVEKVVHGGHGGHGGHDHGAKKDRKKDPISVLDPEQLMHGAEGGHDHNPHQGQAGCPDCESQAVDSGPGMETPEEVIHRGDGGDWAHNHDGEGSNKKKAKNAADKLGVDVEKAVHGHGHVHDSHDSAQPRKKITYKDIAALGLSEDMLQGIDLTKLMAADQEEYEAWSKEGESGGSPSFWDRVNEFRANYLSGLSSHIREIKPPDLETAEWDNGLDDREVMEGRQDHVHEGETRLEHEMEMWGSTAAKNKRKPTHLKLHGKDKPSDL